MSTSRKFAQSAWPAHLQAVLTSSMSSSLQALLYTLPSECYAHVVLQHSQVQWALLQSPAPCPWTLTWPDRHPVSMAATVCCCLLLHNFAELPLHPEKFVSVMRLLQAGATLWGRLRDWAAGSQLLSRNGEPSCLAHVLSMYASRTQAISLPLRSTIAWTGGCTCRVRLVANALHKQHLPVMWAGKYVVQAEQGNLHTTKGDSLLQASAL